MSIKILLLRSLIGSLLCAASLTLANEAQVQRILTTRLPGAVIENVARTPIAGFYEVQVDGEIVYTDAKAEYFFSGSIFDIRTLPPRNITESNAGRATTGVLANASRDAAIKLVKGRGERVLYTFEDPNCGFCKALHKELARLDNVTIYIFPTPLLSQNSADKSVAAWCAADRAQAWAAFMADGELPANAQGCPHPLPKIAALAKRLDITSTPVIFFGNGQRINGFVAADVLEKGLGSSKSGQ